MANAVQSKGIIEVKCNKCGEKFTMPTAKFYEKRPIKVVRTEKYEVNGKEHIFPVEVAKLKQIHGRGCDGTLATVPQRRIDTHKPSRDRKPRAHAKG